MWLMWLAHSRHPPVPTGLSVGACGSAHGFGAGAAPAGPGRSASGGGVTGREMGAVGAAFILVSKFCIMTII